MSKSNDGRFDAVNRMFEELLGPIEDWSKSDVDQFLADAGVDLDAASRSLFTRVSEIAARYREKNQAVPQPIANLLRQFRPVDLATSDPEVAKSAARKWIANLRRPKPQFGAPQLAYAFRNKRAELTPKDQEILDSLEAKLKSRKRSD